MNSGFIILDRKLLEWKYHDLPAAFSLWIHILMKANWKDGYFLGEAIPRGSFATSNRRLADDVGIDVKTLRKYLDRFEEDGMIEVHPGNRFTRIKVLNYSTYQDIKEETAPTVNGTQSLTQTGTRTPYNRTKKQEEQSNNIPPISPKGGREYPRKRKEPVRIDTPDWYKRVQSEGIPEAEPASPELIAEFEAWKEKVSND